MRKVCKNYVNALSTKKIHMLQTYEMLINMWIMWITLFPEKIFADFMHVSGPHSYQQVSVHTVF